MKTNMDFNTAEKQAEPKKQRRLIKKKRAGIVLSRSEVKEIKVGRKKLRKDLRKAGIKSKKDFEVTAASMGLYFDKQRTPFFWLFFKGKALKALMASSFLLLASMFMFSYVSQLKGYFTINLGEDMTRRGFQMSDGAGFENVKSALYAEPKIDVLPTSISKIPEDVMEFEGLYDIDNILAYSFFIRYKGEEPCNYGYELVINSESKNAAAATWIMVFRDEEMAFYAKMGSDGQPEAIPAQNDNTRGYTEAFFADYASNASQQYEVVAQNSYRTFYRAIPKPFESDTVVATKKDMMLSDGEADKYTVVIWVEGDDPECTNDIIGGNVGLEMNFGLEIDESDNKDGQPKKYNGIFDMLNQEFEEFKDDMTSIFDGEYYLDN